MKTPVRRTATLMLLLMAALPAFAHEATGAQQPIAVQMYTLRNAGSLEQQLEIVRNAGVHAVETVGTQNTSAAELKQLLDRYSIRAARTDAFRQDLAPADLAAMEDVLTGSRAFTELYA